MFGPHNRRNGMPTGVPDDHLAPWHNRFIAVDHRGRVTALVAEGLPPMPEITAESTVEDCLMALAVLNGGTGIEVRSAPWADQRQGIHEYVLAMLDVIRPEAAAELGAARLALDTTDIVNARDNAYAMTLAGQIGEGKTLIKAQNATREIVAAMSKDELSEFATRTPQTRERTTAIASPAQLTAKIAHLRERQAETADVPRMKVKLLDVGGLEVEMAVRWDPDAIDPFARIGKDGELTKGAFVSTLPRVGTRKEQGEAMVAAGADIPQIVDSPGGAWHAVLCVEGLRTDEDPGREIMPQACQFPDLPVSLRLQIEDEGGHWGAVTCGRIDTMDREDMEGYQAILGTGVFGTNEHGQLAQLLVEEQTQRFISIDPRDCDLEIVEIEISTNTGGIYYDYDDDECDSSVLYEWWVRYTNLTIGAATIVATPALQQAVIAMASVELPATPIAVLNAPPTSVTVTASGEEQLPSRELFANPGFHVGDSRLVRQADGHYACPLRVDRGTRRAFGHVAYWGANHTGLPGQNRKPPHSPTYAYFMTGARRTAEGETIAVGNITMNCGHASVNIRSAETARAHYQPVSPGNYDGGYGAIQMADVVMGEDDFGIWVSGVLCDGVTEEQIRKFESLGMSGDWRMIAGKLHMVACLAVPVPGFPISREDVLTAAANVIDEYAVRAGVGADGDMFALVAAGRVRAVPVEERLAAMERTLDTLVRAKEAETAAEDLLAIL